MRWAMARIWHRVNLRRSGPRLAMWCWWGRLRAAIRRLNPAIPEEAREDAVRKVLRLGTPSLVQSNRSFHRMLRDGVEVEYARPDGGIAGDHARLLDFDDVRANDWLVVNQFPVIEGQHDRRRLAMSAIQHVTHGALMLIYGNRTPYMACLNIAIGRATYGAL